MDLLVRDYLRNHTFRQLEEEHGVCARPNATGDKFALNYDQILAKNGDPVSEQCRGLVIRPVELDWFSMMESFTNRDWKDIRVGEIEVLAWPMCRFYNFGDPSAVNIDWSHPSLRVYEKVDGTCIICYWDPLHGKWHAGTRSVPEADLPINAGNLEIGEMTFSQLFLKALVRTREELSGPIGWAHCSKCSVMREECAHPDLLCPKDDKYPHDWVVDGPDKVIHLNKEMTYVFELVSPHNQIVVVYPEPRVYLLAARHTQTGREVPIESLRIEHVRRPKTWEIRDIASLSCFVDSANPAELEGAVVCVQTGASFQRLKVKNKTYVLAHKSKDTVTSSVRNALEAVILEKADDIIPLVPKDVQDRLLNMQRAFGEYCQHIDANVATFRQEANGSRKHYAEQVKESGDWTAVYFNLWENRAKNAREWFTSACKNNKLSDSSLDNILAKLTL